MTTLRALRFALTMVAVSAGAHWMLVRWATRAFPRLSPLRRKISAAAALVVVLPIVARLIALRTKSGFAESVQAYGTMELMFALIGALPVLAVEGVTRLITPALGASRATSAAVRGLSAPRLGAVVAAAPAVLAAPEPELSERPATLSRREAIERVGGLVVLGGTGAALGWGMVRGRHAFAVEEVAVRIAGLPRALDGYTIAQVSDIHVGLFVGERELAEGLDRVRALKPDLIVATGDLVDYDPRYAAQMARALGDLAARDGVVAILGNHDYYTGAPDVMAALRKAKVDLLLNAGRRIRPDDGGGFALLGVDDFAGRDHHGGGPDLDQAIAMVPPDAPRILLAHQPKFFDTSAGKVALQLSGHTHGGQINVGLRPADLFMRYVAGRYDRGGSALWVNRGFGVAGPPARLGAPPEVTKIVLVAA